MSQMIPSIRVGGGGPFGESECNFTHFMVALRRSIITRSLSQKSVVVMK